MSLDADRRGDEGDAARNEDRREGPGRFRAQRFERPAHRSGRDARFPQARQPRVARLATEDFERGSARGRRAGPGWSLAGIPPTRPAEHRGQPRELPVSAGGHEIAVGSGEGAVRNDLRVGVAVGLPPSP